MKNPNGINKSWDYISRPDLNQDTVFIRSLVAKVVKDYNIDNGRIHLAGFSNGGFMPVNCFRSFLVSIV